MSDRGPSHLGCATTSDQLYLALACGANHRASLTGERLASEFLEHAPPHPVVVLDLDGCRWIDSTFAGWMIKLRQRLSARGGALIVSHCQESCRASLQIMGLTKLFELRDVAPPATIRPVACVEEGSDPETIAFMVEAHQRLADVSPEHQREFSHIAEELRRELTNRRLIN